MFVCLFVRVTFIGKLQFQMTKTLSLFELYRKSEKGELYEVIKSDCDTNSSNIAENMETSCKTEIAAI